MGKFRIFMIGWEYPPRITGGLAVACEGIASSLGKQGNQVRFLVPRLNGDEPVRENVELIDAGTRTEFYTESELQVLENLALHDYKQQKLFSPYASGEYEGQSQWVREKSQTHSTQARTRQMPLLRGGYGDWMYQEIERYARASFFLSQKFDVDVIHAHDWMTFPAGLAAMNATGKPLVVHVHATEYDRSGDKVNQYVYDLERYAFQHATAIMTVSNYTRTILVEKYGIKAEKIFPVHNAVDFELPRSVLERKKTIKDHIVLFLGRITFQKGPDYFVRAARLVIDQMQNVRFVMAGTGDMYSRMIEFAADLGIGKHFHYTGFLGREQVKRLYSMSDLYVMPSVSEPFGISPLEAMLHGVPVIVSKQSGVSEVIQNCIKVDFWNVEEMADQILRILRDSELKANMQTEGHKEVSGISWDAAASKMEKVYEQIGKK
jgi:glycogen synthase